MIRSGEAIHCGTAWLVGGNKRDGERMIKDYEKSFCVRSTLNRMLLLAMCHGITLK
jgi:hypothetical protein